MMSILTWRQVYWHSNSRNSYKLVAFLVGQLLNQLSSSRNLFCRFNTHSLSKIMDTVVVAVCSVSMATGWSSEHAQDCELRKG